jgi:hypothetical protein
MAKKKVKKIPKNRNAFVLIARNKKGGSHLDRKKQSSKKACRGSKQDSDDSGE